MPLYKIDCPRCGSDEGFSTLKEREAQGDRVECYECDTLCKVLIAPVRGACITSDKPLYSSSLDMTFTSMSSLEKYCEGKGYTVDSPTSTRAIQHKWEAKENHVQMCRNEGFRDPADRTNRAKDVEDDRKARNLAKVVATHDELGEDISTGDAEIASAATWQ